MMATNDAEVAAAAAGNRPDDELAADVPLEAVDEVVSESKDELDTGEPPSVSTGVMNTVAAEVAYDSEEARDDAVPLVLAIEELVDDVMMVPFQGAVVDGDADDTASSDMLPPMPNVVELVHEDELVDVAAVDAEAVIDLPLVLDTVHVCVVLLLVLGVLVVVDDCVLLAVELGVADGTITTVEPLPICVRHVS